MTPRRFKPYPAYKDSGVEWLGEIPAGWEVKRLRRVFRVVNGSTPASGEPAFWDGEIPWVTPEDLGDLNATTITSTRRNITERGYCSCGTTLVPAGSLVLSTRAPIGHLALAGVNLCTNQGCRSLVFRNAASRAFFYYELLAARPELESLGQGSTFRELAKGMLEDVELVAPSEPEQRAIAAFLDRGTTRIDALVAKKERLIELLQEERTALITRAVTKGLDPNVPMKDSGVEWLGEIPVYWEGKRLKFLLAEPLKYGANEAAELDDPDLPRYVRITDIDDGDSLREDTFKSLPADVAEAYLLREGDLLFARSGATAGKTFLYKRSWGICAYAGYLIRARLDTAFVDPAFVRYFTASSSYWQWLSAAFIQATIQNVSADKYASLVMPQPSVAEQNAIAAVLDRETARIDTLITKVRDAIDRLKELRTALISAAVTGKIDVREEAA